MDDEDIVRQINRLVEEEHDLERAHPGVPRTPEEEERLRWINVALDQCWDLLRQRRALRLAGQNPDEAVIRPPTIVESYRQ
jgi:hypothetical protein